MHAEIYVNPIHYYGYIYYADPVGALLKNNIISLIKGEYAVSCFYIEIVDRSDYERVESYVNAYKYLFIKENK